MSNIQPPPIQTPISEQSQDGQLVTLPWTLYFNSLFNGDTGTEWTPEFDNLTVVGTPILTGRYFLISRQLAYFAIRIVPGTSVSATAGLTAVNNFPLQINNDGFCVGVSGLVGSLPGVISQANQKIYIPALSAVTVPVTISGIAEVL